jgi:hypothetical protein
MNLPLIIALTITTAASGGLVTLLGYYTPFMYLSACVLAIGAGLLTTFTTTTTHEKWIGYQIIFGMGIGFGIAQSPIILQVSLPADDVPMATAMVLFVQTLGGAVFIAITQSIFTTQLVAMLKHDVPSVDAHQILNIGATEFRTIVPADLLPQVMMDYNKALTDSWYPAVAMGALAVIGATVVERRNMKYAHSESL